MMARPMRPTCRPRTCRSRPCRSRRRRPLGGFQLDRLLHRRPCRWCDRQHQLDGDRSRRRDPYAQRIIRSVQLLRRLQGHRELFLRIAGRLQLRAALALPSWIRSRRLSPEYDRRHANHLVSADRAGELQRHGSGIRHGTSPRRLCLRPLAGLWDRRRRLDLRQADAHAARRYSGRRHRGRRHDRSGVAVAMGLGRRRRR